ncbi:beta strand repeat-containing protein [Mesorhizobium sp. A623]
MTKWKGAVASFAPNVAEIVTSAASRALPLLLATGLTVGSAAAADRYWDPNATTPGYGGAGAWDLTAQTWSPSDDGVSGPYTAWGNSASDNAIFGGTAGTVTLGSPITAGGLTFNLGGYTLSGGVLTLGGVTPTISTIGSNTGVIINSVIAGSSGLTKAGAGVLSLYGINTFTGDINLNAGRINAGSDAALGAASNDIFTAAGAGVTLSIAGAGTNRTVNIGDGGILTLAGSGAGSALVTGNGDVRLAAGGTLSNDASTYTGSTTFYGTNGVASSYFTSIGNLNEASSLGAPTTVADGTIVFNQSSQYSDNVIYLGDGDSSNRNWDLNGGAALIRNRGTGTLSITGNVDSSGGSGFNAEGADIELLGVLSGLNYSFGGSAGRSITLGDANTFTGTTGIGTITVNASTVADIGSASSFGAGSGAISIANNGTLSYTGIGGSSNRQWTIGSGSILNDGGGALTLSGAVDLGTAANDGLTLGGSFAGINTLSGVVSGTGDLISDGAGTWVLSGTNTREGAIVVEDGTLRAVNASAFGTITVITVNGGTLDLGGFDFTAPSLEGTGGAIALGAGTLTVDTTDHTTYAGDIAGSGGLTKAGVGTLTLSGANTYTGDTSLNGGGLALDFSASGAPASNIIAAASTLNMAGGRLDIIGADSTANVQNFGGLNVTAGSNQIAATSGAGGTMTVNFGAITRTGGLVDFALPASGSFTTTSASLGGWATVNGTDYAKVDGGDIVPSRRRTTSMRTTRRIGWMTR